jgi:demethylmenaquinone methyltransferase/2-methoxy-6-polyprenyl-1,4-benzoquinol methylase
MKMTRLEKKFVNASKHGERNLEILQRLFAHFDRSTVGKVLEIGCGAGTVAAHLSNKDGMQVIATDADPEQVQLAKSHYGEHENLRFLKADATDLPFEDAEFEMALSLNVFHHIGDWGRVLSEVNRVLKPEGYFVFHDLAYSKLAVTVLRPVVRNYGLYTIGDIIEGSRTHGLEIVYQGEPSGMVLAQHSIVFQRNEG